jgi:phosphoribosyl 1,2-cyclic phosphodiesterase
MGFGITVLGSGSRGNAILVHNNDNALLVDAGFSRKELLARISSCGLDASKIRALLISHEHGDHVNGARLFSDELGIPTYVTFETAVFLEKAGKLGKKKVLFETGTAFEIAEFQVRAFAVPHDATDPVGFIISSGNIKIGIATDLGHLNSLCMQRLKDCDVLVLESNHDVEMQNRSDRSQHLKRRVLGKHGHLSNDDAISAFGELVTSKTKCVFLVHLSSDCNECGLVSGLAGRKLEEMGRTDLKFVVVSQDKASQTFWFS